MSLINQSINRLICQNFAFEKYYTVLLSLLQNFPLCPLPDVSQMMYVTSVPNKQHAPPTTVHVYHMQ